MTQVFSNSPRIYGFTALGPSGANAAPRLERYFNSAHELYENFNEASRRLGTAQNPAMTTAFRATTFAQAAGVFAQSSVNGKTLAKIQVKETPYCYLSDDGKTRLAKFKFIESALRQGIAFGFIAHINEFVSTQDLNTSALTVEEATVVKQIGSNPKIKKDFDQYLKLPGEVYLPVRINVVNLMKALGIFSEEEAARRVTAFLNLDFSKPITRQTIDKICSYELRTDLDLTKIPEVRWSEYETFEIMRCLKPRNREIHARILQAFLSDPKTTFIASSAIGAIRPQDPSVWRGLIIAAKSARDSEIRRYAIATLAEVEIQDLQILRELVSMMKNDKDIMIRQNVAYAFRQIKTENIEILSALVQSMLFDPEWTVRSAAGEALTLQNSHAPEIEKYRYIWEGRVP